MPEYSSDEKRYIDKIIFLETGNSKCCVECPPQKPFPITHLEFDIVIKGGKFLRRDYKVYKFYSGSIELKHVEEFLGLLRRVEEKDKYRIKCGYMVLDTKPDHSLINSIECFRKFTKPIISISELYIL